jgi:hypothetical protein
MPIFTSLAMPAKLVSSSEAHSVRQRFFIFIIVGPFVGNGEIGDIKKQIRRVRSKFLAREGFMAIIDFYLLVTIFGLFADL